MAMRASELENPLSGIVGGAEIVGTPIYIQDDGKGRYDIQQDSIVTIEADKALFPDPAEHDPAARIQHYESVYRPAFELAERQCERLSGGSCALIAGACFDSDEKTIHAHTANLGDSTAFLVVYGADGVINREKSRMLNALHEEGNKEEMKRVRDEGGGFRKGRLNGSLAMTRGIEGGPVKISNRGLSTEPECMEHHVTLAEGEKAIMIVSCDGMLEGPFKWNPEMIGVTYDTSTEDGRNKYRDIAIDWFNQAISPEELLNADPRLIAAKFIQKSAETSTDNISIMVERLSPDRPPVLLGVFDGHGRGGENVAKTLAKTLSSELGSPKSLEHLVVEERQPRSLDGIDQFVNESRARQLEEVKYEEPPPALKVALIDLDDINKLAEKGFPASAVTSLTNSLANSDRVVLMSTGDPTDDEVNAVFRMLLKLGIQHLESDKLLMNVDPVLGIQQHDRDLVDQMFAQPVECSVISLKMPGPRSHLSFFPEVVSEPKSTEDQSVEVDNPGKPAIKLGGSSNQ